MRFSFTKNATRGDGVICKNLQNYQNELRGLGLCLEFRREDGHGAALGADVGRDGIETDTPL